jgi:AsmA protein
MKALKILLYAVGGLVVLALLGAGAALLVVDGAFVKSRLERAMKEKNRTLTIEGTPVLRLFPVAGIALGKTSLSEPGGDKPFVSLDSAEVAVRVMPLLSGEIAVETLKLSGARVNLVRRKDVTMNFSDLGDPRERKEGGGAQAPGGKPAKLRVAEVDIRDAQVHWRDDATGQEVSISEVNLKTGRLDGQAPGEVALSARVSGRKPEIDLRAQVSGALRFDLGHQEFAFSKFLAQLKGRFDQDSVSAEFSAPQVEVTPGKASGSEVRGTILVKGPQRNVDARLLVAAVEGTAAALSIPKASLDLDAAAAGMAVKAKLEATLKANLAKQELQAEVGGKLDDSDIKLKLALAGFAPLKATFDLAADRLNVDRYAPPDRKEDKKTDDRVDLSALKGKTVNGKLAIGALTARHVKLENLKAELKLEGGKLEIAPQTANLYGGTLSGSLSADAEGNRVHVKQLAQGVAIGPLLRDALQKDVLEGRGTVSLDVQAAGGTVPALKKALAGSARIELKDGAIKGINLAEGARNLKSAVGIKQAKSDPSQKTDFSEMSASFAIRNGVAHNDDLKAQSPFLRLAGAGDIDVGNNTIEYVAKATLVATAKGQGGRQAGDVAGITIPVKLSGPLDAPEWHVDYSALLGGVVGGAAGGVTETVKKGAGGVTDAVRGLFKRK